MPPSATLPPNPGDLHDEQIVTLLRSGAHAALLSAYFGDVAYRELSQLAKLAAIHHDHRGPLVYILPGIMGSRLGSEQRHSPDLVWLHPAAIAEGALRQLTLPGERPLHAVGIMLPGYLKLKLQLEIAGFHPVFYPFDWRCDLDQLGRAFMQAIEQASSSRVLVVAHSMGGLVARAALAYDKQRRIEKLIQLGAPNSGSFAPVQAMRAVYPTVRKIAALDSHNSAEELAHSVFRTLPGLYQMLPAEFFEASAWPDDGFAPDPALLAHARKVREHQPQADERCLVIAGTRQETVVSAMKRDSQFEYTVRREGDGTVPLPLAHWPGARTWYVDEKHGDLTNNNSVLAAIDDLLKTGDTPRLSNYAPAADQEVVRRVTDQALRSEATHKVRWESLSLDSRRRILDPVISPEFRSAAPAA
jgi:pimeloyl-ACP methyl ester carboxylesterase